MKIPLRKITISEALRAGIPVDQHILIPEQDDISQIPKEVMAEIHKNRNPGNHRRYFAFIKQSFDMQDYYDDIEVWRKVLQLKAGFFDEVISDKGKVIYLPRSIAWDKLDEIEFKDLFTRMVNAFLRDFGSELNDIQINSIVEY